MKYINDYDFVIKCHPGKANVVADTLSRKTTASGCMILEWFWVDVFEDLDVEF